MQLRQVAAERESGYTSSASSATTETGEQAVGYSQARQITTKIPRTGAVLGQVLAVSASVMLIKLVTVFTLLVLRKILFDAGVLNNSNWVGFEISHWLFSALAITGVGYAIGLFANRRAMITGIVTGNLAAALTWYLWLSPILFSPQTNSHTPFFWGWVIVNVITNIVTQSVVAKYVARKHGKG